MDPRGEMIEALEAARRLLADAPADLASMDDEDLEDLTHGILTAVNDAWNAVMQSCVRTA